MKKLIITIAPTGNVPTRELNPYSALTPKEIVDDIERCQKLGASVAHIHVRDKQEFKPTSDREIFKEVLNEIDKRKINIIKQVSTGARGGENNVEWRGQMLDIGCGIEMASLSTASSNFPTSVNANSPDLINVLAEKMYANNIKPEIEIFDSAAIASANRLVKKGIIKGPLHFNLVMGVPGSISATPKHLMFLVEDLPEGSTWTVSGIGKSQVQMLTMAIVMGGHVRTGLEDVLKYKGDVLATNVMLLERVLQIAKAVDRQVANTDEAREILSLQ